LHGQQSLEVLLLVIDVVKVFFDSIVKFFLILRRYPRPPAGTQIQELLGDDLVKLLQQVLLELNSETPVNLRIVEIILKVLDLFLGYPELNGVVSCTSYLTSKLFLYNFTLVSQVHMQHQDEHQAPEDTQTGAF